MDVNKESLKDILDKKIEGCKDQLDNPHLKESLKNYWQAQWDAYHQVAREFDISVEQRVGVSK
jgi:hypothetical protein